MKTAFIPATRVSLLALLKAYPCEQHEATTALILGVEEFHKKFGEHHCGRASNIILAPRPSQIPSENKSRLRVLFCETREPHSDQTNKVDCEAGATFKSLGDQWADTTTLHGKLMVTVLGGLAEFERHLILARTDEGRKRAQSRGVRFGRKPKLTVHQQREALERRARGEALVDIARTYAVSHSTISRLGAVFIA